MIYLVTIAKTQYNPICYDAPFLSYNVNSKTGGMGETGIVSTGRSYVPGTYQNPSLLVKSDKTAGVYISYFSSCFLIIDGFVSNEILFYKWNDKNVIGAEFTYFRLGPLLNSQPNGYSINLDYAHRFNINLSAGAVVKYIFWDLVGNSDSSDEYRPGRTFAVDLGLDYENELSLSENLFVSYDLGTAVKNLGPRISYTDDNEKSYLPTNLAIGSMVSFFFNISERVNIISNVAYQAEKFLVPTPPIYYIDSLDFNGDMVIMAGREPPSSVPLSWIQSLYDAPGGFEEEWHEIIHKIGTEVLIEYTENFKLALRYGRHKEHPTKSNIRYNTFGTGLYIYGITLDARLTSGNTFFSSLSALTAGLQLEL